mgnify:FL=1
MLEVKFYEQVNDELLKFAVILSRTQGKWVFCKHKERTTYEIPGGHREPGETIQETAERELREETGAVEFDMKQVGVYSVKTEESETFGVLFAAEIFSFEDIHSEIESILITEDLVEQWTYPLIQPRLLEEAIRRGF